MQDIVTNRQLFFLIFISTVTASIMDISKTIALSAGRGAWVTIALSSVVYAAAAAIIIGVNKTLDGKTVFDPGNKPAGKIAVFFVSLFYLSFFFTLSVYYCNSFILVVKTNFLPNTPIWSDLLASTTLLGYIAYKGITNAGRLAEIVTPLFLAVASIIFLLMFFEGHINYILPLYDASERLSYLTAMKDTIVPFIGFAILTVVPIKAKSQRKYSAVIFTLVFIGLFYIADVYGCYAMKGFDEIIFENYPLIDAIRLVQLPAVEFLQRLDVLYMTVGFMRVLVGKAVIYLSIVEIVCKMFAKANRLLIVVLTGAAIYSASLLAGQGQIKPLMVKILSIESIAAAFIIQPLILLILKVKKHASKKS
ncbi:MAG: GerAB/ArcD/ProY family transporter [Bacillota bacterium]|nr:GerAB/ArcD/ProY family transporter [Bacillota bacterium]